MLCYVTCYVICRHVLPAEFRYSVGVCVCQGVKGGVTTANQPGTEGSCLFACLRREGRGQEGALGKRSGGQCGKKMKTRGTVKTQQEDKKKREHRERIIHTRERTSLSLMDTHTHSLSVTH